jgi:hypothetical protein
MAHQVVTENQIVSLPDELGCDIYGFLLSVEVQETGDFTDVFLKILHLDSSTGK